MIRNRSHRSQTNRASAFFEPLEGRQLYAGGTMDPTFGQGGKAYTDFGFAALDVAVQRDGKIILVGRLDNDFAVARLNIDGSPDKSFGRGTGLVTTDLGGEKFDVAEKVVIQPDGKIVVGGRKMKSDANGQYGVVRYNTDGKLDNSFSDDGKATPYDRMDINDMGGLLIQPDGRIVFAGAHYKKHLNFTNPGLHYDFRTVRLLANGNPDYTFGTPSAGNTTMRQGYWESDFDGADTPSGVVIQSDGKIVVAGTRYWKDRNDFITARYNVNGTPDNSWDGDGKLSTRVTLGGTYMHDVAIQSDGKIVAVGDTDGRVTLVRWNTDSKVDTTFGGSGVVFSNLSANYSNRASVFALPTGKTLVASWIPGAPAVAQYTWNGAPDTSFTPSGQAVAYNTNIQVKAAARGADGRIVIAGGSGASAGLVRLINAPVQVGLWPWVEGATEGGTKNGALFIGRDGVYKFPTRVWFTIGGNATPLSDYGGDFALVNTIPYQGYVDIPAHRSFVVLPITIRNDSVLEPTETATFTLNEDPMYSGGLNIFASVTIADDDVVNVNFQAPSPVTIGNYRPDIGLKFGDRGLGLSFGWDADNTANARNRNNPRSPDFRYDTYNHMQKNGANRKWEIALPNGMYQVTILAGDPNATDSTYKMNLEGKPALSGKPGGNTRWIVSTVNVQVNDGRLTLSNAAGAQNNKIAMIDIKGAPLGAVAGPVQVNVPVQLPAM